MDPEKEGLLHEMFSRQAQKTPEGIAVVSGDGRQMTYSQLNEWTDILSVYLRIKGVKPDSIVGIYMEKCLEYTISYIAILKAGLCFVLIYYIVSNFVPLFPECKWQITIWVHQGVKLCPVQ